VLQHDLEQVLIASWAKQAGPEPGLFVQVLKVAREMGVLMMAAVAPDGTKIHANASRQSTLDRTFRSNPERLVKKPPEPPTKPMAVWINPPQRNPEPQSLD
jgi:hypothetical protein